MNPILEQMKAEEERRYLKARKDVYEAIKSFRDLSPKQQEKLTEEVFGAAAVSTALKIMQQYLG